ncbi:opioid growth factor receptor-like isoform X2 [Pyxicephalus adspersus]|uniref:opioid growth factor receptor-like isoform X2 n=1 Tax=Pyxicephalus adspersus TaxID=30357 RepID=UPI003B590D06
MAISYDSTWEEDEEWSTNGEKAHKASKQLQNGKPVKLSYKVIYKYMYSVAARDMQNYRHGYRRAGRNFQGNPEKMLNLRFYRNEITFKPNGCYIDELLEKWKEDYDLLEYNHNYIQWLFPLRECGVNPQAAPLQEEEIKIMKQDKNVTTRLRKAYKLMLGFYGLYLKNENNGEVGKTEFWKQRYSNLNNNTHNNLRITRILKCLGELGFEHYQAPLVRFFLEETLCRGQLKNVKRSVLDYFIFSVKNKMERRDLVLFAWKHFGEESWFDWGPVDLLRKSQVLEEHKREDCDTIKKEDKMEQLKSQLDVRKQHKRKDMEDSDYDKFKEMEKKRDELKKHEKLYNNNTCRKDNEHEKKQYKSGDGEKIKLGNGNRQDGLEVHRKVGSPYNTKVSKDGRKKYKTEVRENMKENIQSEMKKKEMVASSYNKHVSDNLKNGKKNVNCCGCLGGFPKKK